MEIDPISSGMGIANSANILKNTGAVANIKPYDFKELLNEAMGEVNKLQSNSDNAIKEYAIGGNIELHDVMISMEKASMALQLTMQIRNKLLDAYQEISRMQI